MNVDSPPRGLKERTRRVGIVGAGLAGSFAGRLLTDRGMDVTLFDKGRGAGGRLSAKRNPTIGRLVHGAPFLHIHDVRLRSFVEEWVEQGHLLSVEPGRYRSHAPNELIKHLQHGLDVRFSHRVSHVLPGSVHISEQEHRFDAIVVTAPAPQTIDMLKGLDGFTVLSTVTYQPCWVAMTEDDRKPKPHPDVHRITGHSGQWALHATASWTRRHLERSPDEIVPILLNAVGLDGGRGMAHRWRYARVEQDLDPSIHGDHLEADGVLVAGDMCAGGDANGALVSALSAVESLMRAPTTSRRTA